MKNQAIRPQAVLSLALGSVLALLLHSNGWAEKPAALQQYMVRFALKRGRPTGSVKEKTLKIEAEPTIVATEKSECNFGVGGEVKVGKEFVFYGTRVVFNLQPVAEGQVMLEGRIEVSHVLNRDIGHAVKEATEIHFAQPVELNKQVKFSISKTDMEERWLEVRIEPVAAAARAAKALPAP